MNSVLFEQSQTDSSNDNAITPSHITCRHSRARGNPFIRVHRMKLLPMHLPQHRANRQQHVNTVVTLSQGSHCTMGPRVREDDERRGYLNKVSRKTLTVTRNHQCKAMALVWRCARLMLVRVRLEPEKPFLLPQIQPQTYQTLHADGSSVGKSHH